MTNSTTLVHLPYSYPVVGIGKGCRTVDTFHFFDEVAVEVPTLNAEEAPIGVRILDHAGVPTLEQRVFERRPLQPVKAGGMSMFANAGKNATLVDAEGWIAAIRNRRDVYWTDYPLPLHRGDYGWVCKNDPRELSRFRRIDSDGQEESHAEALRIARSLVLIDGVLYRSSPEVRWQVETIAVPGGTSSRITAISPSKDEDVASREVFRGDRLGDARKYAEYRQRMAKAGPPTRHNSIEDLGLIDWTLADGRLSAWHGLTRSFEALGGAHAAQVRYLSPDAFAVVGNLVTTIDRGYSVFTTADGVDLMRRFKDALKDRRPEAEMLCRSIRITALHKLWRSEHLEKYDPATASIDEDALDLEGSFS